MEIDVSNLVICNSAISNATSVLLFVYVHDTHHTCIQPVHEDESLTMTLPRSWECERENMRNQSGGPTDGLHYLCLLYYAIYALYDHHALAYYLYIVVYLKCVYRTVCNSGYKACGIWVFFVLLLVCVIGLWRLAQTITIKKITPFMPVPFLYITVNKPKTTPEFSFVL